MSYEGRPLYLIEQAGPGTNEWRLAGRHTSCGWHILRVGYNKRNRKLYSDKTQNFTVSIFLWLESYIVSDYVSIINSRKCKISCWLNNDTSLYSMIVSHVHPRENVRAASCRSSSDAQTNAVFFFRFRYSFTFKPSKT